MKRLFGVSVSLSRNWKKGKGYQLMSGERKRSQSFLCEEEEEEEEKMNWMGKEYKTEEISIQQITDYALYFGLGIKS